MPTNAQAFINLHGDAGKDALFVHYDDGIMDGFLNINVDGGDYTNTHWCGHVEFSPTFSMEALQEFQVLRSTFSAVETTAKIIVFPLTAACAIAYAAHNEHLGRATLLVAVPTLFTVVLLVGFIVGVMIYGF